MSSYRVWVVFVCACLASWLGAPRPASGTPCAAAGAETWRLLVVDDQSQRPLAGARIELPTGSAETDARGQVTLCLADAANGPVSVFMDGYVPRFAELDAQHRSQTIALHRVEGEIIVVLGRPTTARDAFQPVTSLNDAELQRRLGGSIPQTLESVPGFAVEYNGPGAASPSIRGMGSDRVLVLEDGLRLGDLYWSASDHGVMSEAITVKRLEVIRGPAGLLFGSNALGGVVNIVRDEIPLVKPERITASTTTQFESVNRSIANGVTAVAPVGPLGLRLESSIRRGGTTQTPLGALERTEMDGFNLGVGLSLNREWGLVGIAGRYHRLNYGVPGEFAGELVPGGHPGGVDISTRRLAAQAKVLVRRALGPFDHAEFTANVTSYIQDEVEAVLAEQIAYGARFDQVTADARAVAHHASASRQPVSWRGAIGVAAESRDLIAAGASPGTRSGSERSIGVFAYEEAQVGALRLQAGLRYDARRSTPSDTTPIRLRTAQRAIEKSVSARSFSALSGSVAALVNVREHSALGVNLARSFRAPSLPELYSDGPHLADFSFDIGSPDIASEVGWGADVFFRHNSASTRLELATFYNYIQNYIRYAPTGETIRVIRDGTRPVDTPVFEARADNVRFFGAEGQVQQPLWFGFDIRGTLSYTRASRADDGDPLPYIPPLTGEFELHFSRGPFFASVGARVAAAQRRIPRPIELSMATVTPQSATPGHTLWNAGAGWRQNGRWLHHSVTLQAANISNRAWRDHLSRVKDVAPQPGRNIQVTYRMEY